MSKVVKLSLCASRGIDCIVKYFYQVPKNLCKLALKPSSVLAHTYFTEEKEKSKIFVFFSQIKNIVKYGTIDEFFYMYGLNVKPYRAQKEYVHYSEFMKFRDRRNLSDPHNASVILRNKLYFHTICKGFGIPTPTIVAISDKTTDKLYAFDHGRQVTIAEFTQNFNGKLFCKPLNGECGNGVFILEISSGDILIDGNPSTSIELAYRLLGHNYILQQIIRQHHRMSELYDRSINSLRIVTIRNNRSRSIEVLPSILRIGANGSNVDNTSQGGIWVEVDNNTGQLFDTGFYKPEYGLTTHHHPNSGIKFSEFCVPYMKEAVNLCVQLHNLLNLHSIGWDVAISEDGPLFIEGNDNWEINGHQNFNHGLKSIFNHLFK